MAVDAKGVTIPSSEFYGHGYSSGTQAANWGQSKQTGLLDGMQSYPPLMDPRYKATAADKSAFESGFNAGYDEAYKAKATTYGDEYVKAVKADEARQKGLKTVEQWEDEASIPSWGIAQSVASNFNVDVEAFEEKVAASSAAIAKSSYGASFMTRNASFLAEWSATYGQIQAKSGTPSDSVAKIRTARAALNALKSDLNKTVAAPVVFTPVKKTQETKQTKITPPAAAKATIPTWGIVAAVGALGVGGYFLFFHKKNDDLTTGA